MGDVLSSVFYVHADVEELYHGSSASAAHG